MSQRNSTIYWVLIVLLVWQGLGGTNLPAQNAASALSDPRIEERVDALLKQMTLEEKVGQLIQRTAFGGVTGPQAASSPMGEAAAKGEVGSLFNLIDPAAINSVQKAAVENSRLHIPVIFGLDVIHGFRTGFPVPLAMSATWDPALV